MPLPDQLMEQAFEKVQLERDMCVGDADAKHPTRPLCHYSKNYVVLDSFCIFMTYKSSITVVKNSD